MSNILIYLLAWLCVNALLYLFAIWKEAGVLEYVAIFVFMITSVPWKQCPQF